MNRPTDLRLPIQRHVWLANRARNALQRRAFIATIGVATLGMALVSIIVVPRQQSARPSQIVTAPRPDTLSVTAEIARAQLRLAASDSALRAVRAEVAGLEALATLAAQAAPQPDPLAIAHRDSLDRRVQSLERLIARTEQAPLPSSYRAPAEAPELRENARVRDLVASLGEIERERETFGSVGGVDPVFVALTSRLNEIGRSIQALAREKQVAMRAEIARLAPPAPAVVIAPAVDTASLLVQLDSARAQLDSAQSELARRRAVALALDLEERRARAQASAVAPRLALLAAAFVLSGALGFALAFFGELRTPRVCDETEVERFCGVRVLSTIESSSPTQDRGRRQADRAAPPYLDPKAEPYQLAYLALSTDHPSLLTVTVTGDEPAIAAVIGCNLAAIAAEEARNTLLVDMDPSCNGSSALRVRAQPGVADIVSGRAKWPDCTVVARVGRDRTVDVVPCGIASAPPSVEELKTLARQDAARLERYYDAVFVLATPSMVGEGLAASLPSRAAIYCAQPGITPLRKLREELERARAAGALVKGVVLWNAEGPTLAPAREIAAGASPPRPPRAPRAPEPQPVA